MSYYSKRLWLHVGICYGHWLLAMRAILLDIFIRVNKLTFRKWTNKDRLYTEVLVRNEMTTSHGAKNEHFLIKGVTFLGIYSDIYEILRCNTWRLVSVNKIYPQRVQLTSWQRIYLRSTVICSSHLSFSFPNILPWGFPTKSLHFSVSSSCFMPGSPQTSWFDPTNST